MFRDCAEEPPRPPWDTLPLEQRSAGSPQRQCVGQDGEQPADNERAEAAASCVWDLQAPSRGGLSAEATATVGARRDEFGLRLRDCFKTRTRDTSANADDYLRGPLTMDNERHFAHRARHMPGDDGPALQHLLSNSPWAGHASCGQMPAESKATAVLAQGSTLMREESAAEQAGTHHAGASRPYHGRRGQVDVCRVDTGLTEAHGGLAARVDGALCVPAEWCGAALAQRRPELGIPAERRLETPLQWGLQRGKRVKAHGLPFALLACDALYGRDSPLRAEVDAAGVGYAAPVPADTHVYLSEPRVGVPEQRGTRGRPRPRLPVLSQQRPHAVRALARHPQTVWQQVVVRHPARGRWAADVAVPRVWTVAGGTRARAAWLVRRRAAAGDCSSTRRNAPEEAPHEHLSAWSCRRSFAERTCAEAKTASGWDACQAQQYRAWEHHWAHTAAAVWGIAQTQLAWAQAYPRDPA